jgi:hypothetical protein
MIASLKNLRDSGNTVIVVEHDKDMMLESDYVVDIGPKAGRKGGNIVFCGTPKAELIHTIGFSFLNASRKEQFVWMLSKLDCLPVYYPDDAEVYLKTGLLPDGERIVAVFNLGLDPLEELPLVFDSKEPAISSVSRVTADGNYEPCDFSDTSPEGEKGDAQGTVFVKVPVNTMEPVILIVK